MPSHLKMETGNADDPTAKRARESRSMPAKKKRPPPGHLKTIATPDELHNAGSPIAVVDAKRRNGSTGGSSLKDQEVIRSEVKMSGSPSPSPPSHPQYPLMINPDPALQTMKQITPKAMLNQTQMAFE